jgi:uncharacterized Zn finger protein (UPF0148 family)
MSRDVPFDEKEVCDKCGAPGAFDFMGDFFCPECGEADVAASDLLGSTRREVSMDALKLAVLFHETYERLAPSFGYETRDDTKKFDETSKNGMLMVAVCGEILLVLEAAHGVQRIDGRCPKCDEKINHLVYRKLA